MNFNENVYFLPHATPLLIKNLPYNSVFMRNYPVFAQNNFQLELTYTSYIGIGVCPFLCILFD